MAKIGMRTTFMSSATLPVRWSKSAEMPQRGGEGVMKGVEGGLEGGGVGGGKGEVKTPRCLQLPR